MNLYAKLLEREAAGQPVRIGLIGAGKFGTMFLSQVIRTRGMHVVGLADLNVARARSQFSAAGWQQAAYEARNYPNRIICLCPVKIFQCFFIPMHDRAE